MTSDTEIPMQDLVPDQSTFSCVQQTHTRLQSQTEMQEMSSFRETKKKKKQGTETVTRKTKFSVAQ